MAIVVPIDADVSGLTRKLGSATSSLHGFGKMALFVAGAAALGGLIATVKVGVDEFMQAEKVTAQTNAVLKSTGSVANVTKRQIEDLATSIMRKSGMDDEAIKSAENLLLTFTKVRDEAGRGNDVFSQATKITADLSVALGKDLNSSAMMVGKALNDPIKGISALSRAGVQFTADQKDMIKSMVDSGNVMGAQKLILKELETQVGGSAQALGGTLTGKLNIAKETFRNMAADLVVVFMPAIATAVGAVSRFISQLAQQPTLKAKLDFVMGSATDVVARFWTWWTQPSMEKVRSPTSGVHVIFTPPGSEQVGAFIISIDTAVTARLNRWSYNAGYGLMDSLFGGTKDGAAKKAGSFLKVLTILINPMEFARWSLGRGVQLMSSLWDGITGWINDHPGVATKAIKDWVIGAGDAIGGPVKAAVDAAFRKGAAHLLPVATIATKITADMKAAVQSARSGLAGAASGLGGMISQLLAANMAKAGSYGNAASMTSEGRSLEDQRRALQKESLEAALKAATESGEGVTQAQLDLDQFYYDEKATLRQRDVDDESKKQQTQIEDLAARFNKGLISATEFSTELDGLIGGETGTTLGEAFSLGFTNAIAGLKNAANDIANIVGMGNPLGPEVGATGGPVSAAAESSYNEAHAAWLERRRKYREQLIAAKKDGKRVYDAAEVRKMMGEWDDKPTHREPKRADYGLATGGLLTGPRYLAGEAGNEAVIPLNSPTARDMMRRAFADSVNGGNSTTYQITINAGMGTDGTDVGRQLVEQIKVFERRNGPVFVAA